MRNLAGRTSTPSTYADFDVILIDESHNFRNEKANRYLALDTIIQQNGGRGRDGDRKKVILLSATPINNDILDLASQVRLFTQSQPDYFREAGIGDLNAYFKRARKLVNQQGAAAGIVLFNLLEEIMVRNTRPYIKAAYPNATIKGKAGRLPGPEAPQRLLQPWLDLRRALRRNRRSHRGSDARPVQGRVVQEERSDQGRPGSQVGRGA